MSPFLTRAPSSTNTFSTRPPTREPIRISYASTNPETFSGSVRSWLYANSATAAAANTTNAMPRLTIDFPTLPGRPAMLQQV